MHEIKILFGAVIVFALVGSGYYVYQHRTEFQADKKQALNTMIQKLEKTVDHAKTAVTSSGQVAEERVPTSAPSDNIQRAPISIKSVPPSAEIEINGAPHGNAPAELTVPLKTHLKITFKQKGYHPFTEEFTVDGPKEVSAELKPDGTLAAASKQNAPAKSGGKAASKKAGAKSKK